MNKFSQLTDLQPGKQAIIRQLEATGGLRRRLQDLGLVENTAITCLGHSPMGDPSAYLIRGAVIALRHEDSRYILVEEEQSQEK